MKKEDRKNLHRSFSAGMKKILPAFRKIGPAEIDKNNVMVLERKNLLFGQKVGPELWFFLYLRDMSKFDYSSFIVMVAYSHDGEFPGTPLGPYDEPENVGRAFALPKLWHERMFPMWYLDAGRSEKEIAPSVEHSVTAQCDDCLEKIHEFVIPYFMRVAREHKQKWNTVVNNNDAALDR